MRNAISAITDELRRLKASGVSRVSVSEGSLGALRAAVGSEPRAAAAAAPAKAAVPEPLEPARAEPPKAAPPPREAPPTLGTPPPLHLPSGAKQVRWDALKAAVLSDPTCAARVRPGKKIVVGVGTLDAQIMFVGEAPGADEEVQGEPFVGPAGQLLNRMIAGMALTREKVYIGNIMNWRPEMATGADGVQTGNRPPTDAELAYCLPYLRAQIEIVNPEILVALGSTAAKGLLGSKSFGALKEVRGRWHDFGGKPLMVTYHPSYILRNPTNSTKRLIWEDLLKVMERANMPVTEKQRGYFL
jgi:DNA polymerase